MSGSFPDLNKFGALLDNDPSGAGYDKAISKDNLHYSDVQNLICDRYEINTTYELKDLSNEFIQVYPVVDTLLNDTKDAPAKDTAPDNELFAYVYHSNSPIPISEIITLCSKKSEHINLPIAYGVCPLGTNETERFVAIIPKQQGQSLKSILNTSISLDEKFLKVKLLPQILKAFENLHSSKIAYGNLNANTIFFDRNGTLILKEFISEPSGYSQFPLFDTIERAQCIPIAKGPATPEDDYYALGVLLFTILTKKEFEHLDQEDMLREKLYKGTAHFLYAAKALQSVLGELIKGLVCDDPSTRFSHSELNSITNGKPVYFNSVDKSYLSRAIIFSGKEHHSKQSLAYDLYCNWEKAREYAKSDKIIKWLESTVNEEKTCEALKTLSIPLMQKSAIGSIISKEDELLIKTIIILDPYGPVRAKHLCFNLEGLGPLLCNSLNLSHSSNTQLIAGLMFNNIFSLYDFMKITFSKVIKNRVVTTLEKCAEYIKKGEFGFGLERCLYDLNPTLVCQSNIVLNKFCIDLTHLLDTLDKSTISFEDLVSKKTLCAFIGSRVGLKKEIENKELSSFPVLRKSRSYQLLGIFTIAQKLTNLSRLVNLAKTINSSIIDVLEITLKSRHLRKLFFNQLNTAAESGCIADLNKIALKSPYLTQDSNGYAKAVQRGASITAEIFSYNNRNAINNKARKTSLQLAVKFSYLVCGLVVMLIMLRGF